MVERDHGNILMLRAVAELDRGFGARPYHVRSRYDVVPFHEKPAACAPETAAHLYDRWSDHVAHVCLRGIEAAGKHAGQKD